jgi:hypothetical protein
MAEALMIEIIVVLREMKVGRDPRTRSHGVSLTGRFLDHIVIDGKVDADTLLMVLNTRAPDLASRLKRGFEHAQGDTAAEGRNIEVAE